MTVGSRLVLAALALALAVPLAPRAAAGQSYVEGELNRGKAALQLKRYDEAAARFDKLARAGNPVAQFYMGRLTAMGLGVAQDLPKATEWFQLSARQGYVEAQAVLGVHYMEGIGVAPSYAEAARWSKLAADQGHGGAAYNLAKMYTAGGPGLAADRALAEKWAKIAVAKGFPDPLRAHAEPAKRAPEALAIGKEGDRLFNAGGLTGASRACARCADMGDASCQLNLGWLYEQGKGVPQNLATAVHYGFGVKEDKAKAHAFYRQSAALGNHKANEALITFDRFSWPDQKSQDIYTARVTAYMNAINGCQARANAQGSAVSCLVPGVDWNPKTWESC